MRKSIVLALILLALASVAAAADAYVLRFNSYGRSAPNDAGKVLWLDDVLFFNTNATPVVVHAVGASNGTLLPDAPTLTLPPGHVVSLDANLEVSDRWKPRPIPGLYVLHLDIPTGVIVESRDEFHFDRGIPELSPFPLGKVSMPVFHDLTPAGTPQIQLGTDLSGTTSRLNVGIYNAGSDTATATIEARRTCDDSVTDTRTLSIPSNTLIQVNGLQIGAATACTTPALNAQVTRYTVITVSQPSLTYVANLTETVNRPPEVDAVAPIVGLAVTQNSKF